MPELPEVEIMRRNVDAWGAGRHLVRFVPKDPKWQDLVVPPGPIRGTFRRGKALVWNIGDHSLLLHFRMTGKIVQWHEERRYTRACFELSDGMTLAFVDQRRFADLLVMSPVELQRYLEGKKWGPEPWPDPLPPEWWVNRFGNLKMAVKPALMRADCVVGIGNILASEICHAAGVHPERRCSTLTSEDWLRLSGCVVPLIDRVIDTESGPEIAYVNQGGGGSMFSVYGRSRKGCLRCGVGVVQQIRQSGRSTYLCPNCQK